MDYSQQGFVLVIALLFLSVITLLVSSAFSLGLLQNKMSLFFYQQALSLQRAELALLVGEGSIKGEESQGEGVIDNYSRYNFKRRAESICGGVYYQIDASGTAKEAKSELQSILLIPQPAEECPNPVLSRQRVGWWQIY